MRAIWKGAVSFGLVSIAVKLYSATEERDIRFHQVHRSDGGRIRYQRVCAVDGEEVSYDDIAKGYDLGGGEMVILTDEDFADLPLSTSRAIDVLEFVPAEQVDPILYAKSYYLEPEGTSTKPYLLLRDALTGSDRVAIVKVALRQREQLATLRVRDGVLVLNTMLWPDEVRPSTFAFLDEDVMARPAELAMAQSLIESMAADFDPNEYSDDYRAALQEVIDAKVQGRDVVAAAEPEAEPVAAIDLMAALRASVERARAARGEAPTTPPATPAAPTPITSARSVKTADNTTAAAAKTTAAARGVGTKTTAAARGAGTKTTAAARGAGTKTTAAAGTKTTAAARGAGTKTPATTAKRAGAAAGTAKTSATKPAKARRSA